MRPGRFRAPRGVPLIHPTYGEPTGIQIPAAIDDPNARPVTLPTEAPTVRTPDPRYSALQFRKDLTDPVARARDLENLANLERPKAPPGRRCLICGEPTGSAQRVCKRLECKVRRARQLARPLDVEGEAIEEL